jgi:hypothetical protein
VADGQGLGQGVGHKDLVRGLGQSARKNLGEEEKLREGRKMTKSLWNGKKLLWWWRAGNSSWRANRQPKEEEYGTSPNGRRGNVWGQLREEDLAGFMWIVEENVGNIM